MSKKQKLPAGNYRAVAGDHVMTALENDLHNKRVRSEYSSRLCCCCWSTATVIVAGAYYCKEHAQYAS